MSKGQGVLNIMNHSPLIRSQENTYGVDYSFPVHSRVLRCGPIPRDRQTSNEDFTRGCREQCHLSQAQLDPVLSTLRDSVTQDEHHRDELAVCLVLASLYYNDRQKMETWSNPLLSSHHQSTRRLSSSANRTLQGFARKY
jgi:hypothetical protein